VILRKAFDTTTNTLAMVEEIVTEFQAEPKAAYTPPPPRRHKVSAEKVAFLRSIGSKGGRATVERHGVDHMRAIGKAGFEAALIRSGYSDAGHFVAHLIETGRMNPRRGA
jgi:hypothetical protein